MIYVDLGMIRMPNIGDGRLFFNQSLHTMCSNFIGQNTNHPTQHPSIWLSSLYNDIYVN